MAQPVRAKKHLGQHFLCDEGIARKIVDGLLSKDKSTCALEIGPGTGVLTKYLIQGLPQFYALDIDQESIDYLRTTYPEKANQIRYCDFLEVDLKQFGTEKFNVIGNFPYNISSQIMFKVLEHRNEIPFVVGMFQKEVAKRIAEKPGTKVYGILSVLLQAFYEIEYLFTVHENVFSPPPKVKSGVIRLTRNKRQMLSCNEDLFFKVVKTTFNQRRKTIRNSIKPLLNGKELQPHILLDKRPEQLSVLEFEALTNHVFGSV
jgi:16S rRNA (adenine1518-N6/adenine1519-N6)-dimethyltransferase